MKYFVVIVVVACVVLIAISLTPINVYTKKHGRIPALLNKQEVSIYLVAVGDDGNKGKKIGCGDSLVSVKKEIPKTDGVLRAALTELFAVKEENYEKSGLTNALADSNLQVDDIRLNDGVADIYLSGNLSLGGICDNPRVEEQLKATALQFPTIKTAHFYLNNTPLSEALSQQ